jgi:hypothetical protein
MAFEGSGLEVWLQLSLALSDKRAALSSRAVGGDDRCDEKVTGSRDDLELGRVV